MEMYTIGQFSKLTGVTIRTLHYYDERDLLKPIVANNGRRFYNDEHLLILQTILVCKYLDYSLEDIKAMLAQEKPLLQSMHEQKTQLEQKRKQLDQMIASMETAIAIHEKMKIVEPTSLLVVIHSLFTVEEQKKYLQGLLSKELVDKMYDYFNENFVELNRLYIEGSYALKEAYEQHLPDEEVKEHIISFLKIIPPQFVELLGEELANKEVEEMDKWLFTSLFTKEEECWLDEKIEQLQIVEELFDERTNTAALDDRQSK